MLTRFKLQRCFRVLRRKCFSQHLRHSSSDNDLKIIRNIGILAHIDAGKTTTTERMLFYSGTINSMGEVHYGNTVTDYLEQERERGITITAAAVSFMWDDHQFNLIDTPGHIDFTMEVEQSLAVLDGVVVVLDASAGVEAQTLTVWRQANDHRLPRIIYANKMDRKDASLDICLNTLREYLDVEPLCLQLPVQKDNSLVGIIDVINSEVVSWSAGSRGRKYEKRKLTESGDGATWERAVTARRRLVDSLTGFDDGLADAVIQSESLDTVGPSAVRASVRRATLSLDACPLLCGSSYKNVGVQLLMDGVVDYLPSPVEAKHFYSCFESDLCAKVFKIQHSKQKGVLTFLRLFEGEIAPNKRVYNVTRQTSDQVGPMYAAYADEFQPMTKVAKGHIAVVSGLKSAMSGDLITNSQATATRAKKNLTKQISGRIENIDAVLPPAISLKVQETTEPSEIVDSVFGLGANVPDPVFMRSIEPPSLSYQALLETALGELQREDPSLRVIYNEDTAQTVLAGMGELHLDVVKQKILEDYKLEAFFGELTISYKELLIGDAKDKFVFDHTIASQKQYVNVVFSVRPLVGPKRDEPFRLDNSSDSASNLAHVPPRYMQAIKRGVEASIINGPKASCPIINADITLHWLETKRGTSETAVTSAASQCLRWLYKKAGTVLMEPVMRLQINTLIPDTSRLLGDLIKRQSTDLRVNKVGKNTVISCITPLSRLIGFANEIQQMTSGMSTFSIEFHMNREVPADQESDVLQRIRGF